MSKETYKGYKGITNIIPHSAALIAANGDGGYDLVEYNQIFRDFFDMGGNYVSDFGPVAQKCNDSLRGDLIEIIKNMAKKGINDYKQQLSDYNVILKKINPEEELYLLILFLDSGKEMQVTIKNYESFYNAIDDMFLVGDQDGTILFSNHAVTRKLGYSAEELKNMHILTLHPQAIREEAEQIFAEMFRNEREVCPLPLIKKNGELLPVETRVWFGDWNGKEQLFAISRDLSAEQENFLKFNKLFDRNPASMMIISLESSGCTQVNEVFLKTFGFSEDEVIGKSLAELDIITDLDAHVEMKRELVKAGFISERILNTRKKTGEEIVGLFSGEIIESNNEKLIMLIMVDLTRQIEAERQLAKKSELQEILIGLSSRYINCSMENIEEEIQVSLESVGTFVDADRVYIFDYDYEKNTTSNTFEWCNISIEPQIDSLQDVPLEIIPDWVESHMQGEIILIPDVSLLDGTVSAVKEILEPQGVKSLVTIPMMFEGRCLGYVGFDSVGKKHIYTDSEIDLLKFYSQILANIHLRKAHEQEMQTARIKAEKANEAKNYFIAKTSHELRNPINGAWGFLNLLAGLVQGGEERRYLQNSIQALSSAIRILNDLLDISRIETNELRLKDERINIFSLMSEAIVPYKQEFKSKGIQVDIKQDSDIPQNLIGDFSRLKQIIGNLVLNAATHAGATTIEVACFPKSQTSDSIDLLFSVKDNGIGMSQETQEKIFNLFYKENVSSPGSGLGLPICKEFINLMGGEIWVESGFGKGSEFKFTLPLRIGKEDDLMVSGLVGKDICDLKGMNILLAEDNDINQQFMIEILKPKGITVTAVSNGAEAIKALEANQYDLILMDIQMPVMDGSEAIKRIRESQNPIPIIALTGAVLPQEKESYLNYGANEIVEKPIFLDVLFEKICNVLNNKIH